MTRGTAGLRAELGAVSAEFVLVFPAAIFLTLGSLNLGILMFTVTNLNSSVDEAARWAAIQKTLNNGTAPTLTAVTNFANDRYKGPRVVRVYAYDSAAACGNQVSVTATFHLVTGIHNVNVPITAKSCYST